MKTNLNLIPAQFHRRLILRSSLLLWSGVGALVFAAMISLVYRQHVNLSAARGELAIIEARCRPVRATLQENTKLGRRISELHGRQTLLAHLNSGRHPLQLVGLVSRSARSAENGLKVVEFSYGITKTAQPAESADRPADGNTEPPAPIETIRLTLNGIAANDLAVSKFIVALRDSGYFASVELKSSVRAQNSLGNTREFLVDCTL